MLTVSLFLGPEERERVWDTYSGLERELGTLRETLEYLLHLGSPQVHPCPKPANPALLSQVHSVISINAGKTVIKCNILSGASLIAQLVKNPPAMQETPVRFLGWEDPLEKGEATHFSILAWRIPWTV